MLGGICTCGVGPGCVGTSGLEGCIEKETRPSGDPGEMIANETGEHARMDFLVAYFTAMSLLCACAFLAEGQGPDQEDETEKFTPTCCSANWIAAKLGVLDEHTGELIGLCAFWRAQHDIARLCGATCSPHGRFTVLNFFGDVAFTVSAALMLESVNIGSTVHATLQICNHLVKVEGGKDQVITTTHLPTADAFSLEQIGFGFETSGGFQSGEPH